MLFEGDMRMITVYFLFLLLAVAEMIRLIKEGGVLFGG